MSHYKVINLLKRSVTVVLVALLLQTCTRYRISFDGDDTVAVRGKVVDAVSGSPLPSATVLVVGDYGGHYETTMGVGVTDATGTYTFPCTLGFSYEHLGRRQPDWSRLPVGDLNWGTYTIEVKAEGYSPYHVTVQPQVTDLDGKMVYSIDPIGLQKSPRGAPTDTPTGPRPPGAGDK